MLMFIFLTLVLGYGVIQTLQSSFHASSPSPSSLSLSAYSRKTSHPVRYYFIYVFAFLFSYFFFYTYIFSLHTLFAVEKCRSNSLRTTWVIWDVCKHFSDWVLNRFLTGLELIKFYCWMAKAKQRAGSMPEAPCRVFSVHMLQQLFTSTVLQWCDCSAVLRIWFVS